MTIEVVGGKARTRKTTKRAKPRVEVVAAPLAIGEPEANIFSCPVCGRPLATGASRCPGCRTRLILATPMRRVAIFVSAGLIAGLLLTWLVSSAVAFVSGPARTTPGVGPLASSGPGASAVAGTPAPTIPPAGRSALSQAATLNARFQAAGAELRKDLRQANLDSPAVANTLRQLASDATFGEDLAPRLGTWDAAVDLSGALAYLYGSIRTTARDALGSSINNDPAYRDAAQKMLSILGDVGPLDVRVRELAAASNIKVPPPGSVDFVTQ
ncbi:MAG: hypothetical protein M3067_01040 [Chloroflexota bacterium]|nr:hypothetical protein [Chloroflexota bacterium]